MTNKKNWVVGILLAAFFAWFCVRYFNRDFKNPRGGAPNLALDWDSLDKKQNAETAPTTLKTDEPTPHRTRTHETMTPSEEAQFEIYDQMEREWLGKMKALLDEREYVVYQDMREQNEKEKLKAYEQFHQMLRKRHGDQFSYKISEDQTAAEKEINQKYLNELLALIGEKKFAEYLKARDQINENFRRKNKIFIQVEF